MIYLDSSALTKLIKVEPETPALKTFLAARGAERRTASALVRTEVIRSVLRVGPDAVAAAQNLVRTLDLLALSPQILDEAAVIRHGVLRTLDAIHLASALRLAGALSAFVAYDKRLAESAIAAGLPVVQPS